MENFIYPVYHSRPLLSTRFQRRAGFCSGVVKRGGPCRKRVDRRRGTWYNKGAGTSGRKEVFIMFAVLANFLLAIVAGLVANQLSKWLDR